jgi:glucosylglycerate synthase
MVSTGSSSSIAEAEAAPGHHDVVVGIQSYNDAETIAGVVASAREGMRRHGGSGCVILADGASTDQTLAIAQEVAGAECSLIAVDYRRPEIDPLKLPYHGRPGRAAAMRAVLRAARDRHAKACVMLDARLINLRPETVERLIEPALRERMDYVSAHYVRHPHEGAITKSLIYPLFRALYGVRLRQPAALEFACSAPLMDHFLKQRFWDTDGAPTGIDLWLAVTAVTGGYRVGEAVLGIRSAAVRQVAPDLSTALGQIVGALFIDLKVRASFWHRVRGSVPVEVVGDADGSAIPPAPDIEPVKLLESFRLGYAALRDVWAAILPPRTIIELKRCADIPPDRFRIHDDLWARIVYDFALGHHLKAMPHEHLLGALVPLYLGWLASFMLEPGTDEPEAAERRIDRLGTAFETQKPYLISRWRWPERFRS